MHIFIVVLLLGITFCDFMYGSDQVQQSKCYLFYVALQKNNNENQIKSFLKSIKDANELSLQQVDQTKNTITWTKKVAILGIYPANTQFFENSYYEKGCGRDEIIVLHGQFQTELKKSGSLTLKCTYLNNTNLEQPKNVPVRCIGAYETGNTLVHVDNTFKLYPSCNDALKDKQSSPDMIRCIKNNHDEIVLYQMIKKREKNKSKKLLPVLFHSVAKSAQSIWTFFNTPFTGCCLGFTGPLVALFCVLNTNSRAERFPNFLKYYGMTFMSTVIAGNMHKNNDFLQVCDLAFYVGFLVSGMQFVPK